MFLGLVVPHVSWECFVDDTRPRLLGAAEGKVQRVYKPRQEVDGVALKTNSNEIYNLKHKGQIKL